MLEAMFEDAAVYSSKNGNAGFEICIYVIRPK
jgi:hypothetical protein